MDNAHILCAFMLCRKAYDKSFKVDAFGAVLTPTLDLLTVSIILVLLGLFLLFAFAFNGSVGVTFVNYTFCASALSMLIAGSIRSVRGNLKSVQVFCSMALALYLPMIWQRFNFSFSVDSVGLTLDIFIVLFLTFCITRKPKESV